METSDKNKNESTTTSKPPSGCPQQGAGDSQQSSDPKPPPVLVPGSAVGQEKDRVSQIMDYLNDPTLDTLPDHLKMKYEDGFDPDKLEEQLQSHPFFMTEFPDPSKPLPPLLEAFQQIKYSEEENTNHELALNHKEDGLFHFKLKKYRIAATCFTTALSYELKCEDKDVDRELVASLYNNRSACSFFIGNYRSCLKDCKDGLKYKPKYIKIIRRAILATEKLEKWTEVEEFCKIGELAECQDKPEELKWYLDRRMFAKRGKTRADYEIRKKAYEEGNKQKEKEKLLALVKQKGINVSNWSFLDGPAAQEGRHVKLAENKEAAAAGELAWPVLFMYPQYQESDFIEAFNENDSFGAHLTEMLDDNRPGWDVDNEYHCATVEIYFLGQKFVKIESNSSLMSVMKEEWYQLPSTGVPTFFIVCGNQFSKDFLERVDVMS